ncbi:copper homeostasis protein CutC [Atopococcus tabaci]|uniref:copper homeostasis protein CutC n=1 Tax=Atopococcus tabaci TaxID=269774 RepID=UPI00240A76CA|nr:copper homeostasis protein CutC [Atopococcus tabaci]
MRKRVEICCGSVEDAVTAEQAGADRIEFNQALYLGGLTPSIGSLKLVLETVRIPVVPMVRPRAGGFSYTETEFHVIMRDVEEMCALPIAGVAFGCLDSEKRVDVKKNRLIVEKLHRHRKEAVFHRAFDVTPDPFEAMETLIELGVNRVLTSSQQPTAPAGTELLKQLQQRFGHQIEILAGGGVNASNVQPLMQETGIAQVHSSCRGWQTDPATIGNVSFGYAEPPHESDYEVVDSQTAAAFVRAAKNG